MKICIMISLLVFLFAMHSSSETVVNEPFGTNFTLKKNASGEILTVSAFTADSSFFYLYDMADRSVAQFDSNGTFIKKTALQNIGRGTYVGDDFVIRGDEAIFLNTVDCHLEFFSLTTGFQTKTLLYPRNIPLAPNQRRYRIITRIYLENNKIFIGNSRAVFHIDEHSVLQKVTSSQVKTFSSKNALLLFDSKNPVMFKTGTVQWKQKSTQIEPQGYPMSGKNIAIMGNTLFTCKVDKSGISITPLVFTE